MARVDLEDLAAGYQHRPASEAALARARRAAVTVGLEPGDIALDLGGGRGEHAAVWLEQQARPVVVDASRGMARVASSQAGVDVVCAYAQSVPLLSGCARLTYFHLSLHYGDWRASLDEAGRLLRSGGECWIWTMGEAHHRSSMLARWFPSVGDIDAARFPDPSEVAQYLDSIADFVEVGVEIEQKAMPAGSWRRAVVARFVSTLQLIPPDEFDRGLVEFDAAYPDQDQLVDYELGFDWLRAGF